MSETRKREYRRHLPDGGFLEFSILDNSRYHTNLVQWILRAGGKPQDFKIDEMVVVGGMPEWVRVVFKNNK
ncbi:MAG: hypothetical protein V4721_13945 [Bacteroidota bacterium]